MKSAPGVAAAFLAMAAPCLAAPAEPIRLELNAAEAGPGGCRLTFVIENEAKTAIDSLKLDLAVFGRSGIIQRRLVAEMGPLRAVKTVVKAFEVEGACDQIGSILVNDVAACAPGDAGTCLDRLMLASRSRTIRLFK